MKAEHYHFEGSRPPYAERDPVVEVYVYEERRGIPGDGTPGTVLIRIIPQGVTSPLDISLDFWTAGALAAKIEGARAKWKRGQN